MDLCSWRHVYFCLVSLSHHKPMGWQGSKLQLSNHYPHPIHSHWSSPDDYSKSASICSRLLCQNIILRYKLHAEIRTYVLYPKGRLWQAKSRNTLALNFLLLFPKFKLFRDFRVDRRKKLWGKDYNSYTEAERSACF